MLLSFEETAKTLYNKGKYTNFLAIGRYKYCDVGVQRATHSSPREEKESPREAEGNVHESYVVIQWRMKRRRGAGEKEEKVQRKDENKTRKKKGRKREGMSGGRANWRGEKKIGGAEEAQSPMAASGHCAKLMKGMRDLTHTMLLGLQIFDFHLCLTSATLPPLYASMYRKACKKYYFTNKVCLWTGFAMISIFL